MPDTDLITAKPAGFAGTPPAPPAPPEPGRPPATQLLPGVRAKLAELSGRDPVLPFDDGAVDSLAPARGIAVAVAVVTPFWATVGAGLWAVLK